MPKRLTVGSWDVFFVWCLVFGGICIFWSGVIYLIVEAIKSF